MSTERIEYRIVTAHPACFITVNRTFRDDQPHCASDLSMIEAELQLAGVPYRVEWRTVIELLGEWQPRTQNGRNESIGRIQDGKAANDWHDRER